MCDLMTDGERSACRRRRSNFIGEISFPEFFICWPRPIAKVFSSSPLSSTLCTDFIFSIFLSISLRTRAVNCVIKKRKEKKEEKTETKTLSIACCECIPAATDQNVKEKCNDLAGFRFHYTSFLDAPSQKWLPSVRGGYCACVRVCVCECMSTDESRIVAMTRTHLLRNHEFSVYYTRPGKQYTRKWNKKPAAMNAKTQRGGKR